MNENIFLLFYKLFFFCAHLIFDHSVESCRFSDSAEINAECFNFDEKFL